jgi:hypothetical protein
VLLDDEVDEAGGAARRGGAGAGVVVVDRHGPAEGHGQVGVVVDQARQDVAARGVDRLGVLHVAESADGRDLLAVDQHVGP